MRGVAGEYPLDPATVQAFGQALGKWARGHAEPGQSPRVLVGMDTRESGPALAESLAGGLAAEGVAIQFAGLITTPGVAWLTKTGPFVAGVMISASHNPYHDNGLKAFDHSGFKLPDATELELEREIFALLEARRPARPLPLTADPGLDAAYLDSLAATFPRSLAGVRIVLDCANGAATHLGPELFKRLGADVIAIGCQPNGRNINDQCGALHVEDLRDRVLAEGADFGFAFDGDADRCIGVTHGGRIVDGDAMLLVCGRHLHRANRLGAAVVATVMSNLGFEKALERDGIALIRTGVGDKYVLEEMLKRDLPIGGEQSGHVIFREFATTGDGLLSALRVLDAALADGRPLDEQLADLVVYPQRLTNLKVREKIPVSQLPGVSAEIAAAEADFAGNGRVLVRYSGTEPKIRVMVEGADSAQVDRWLDRIVAAVRAELT
jgi:phosphoglucosamine mutase